MTNQIVRIKDQNDNLQSWIVVDRIVNKYNPAIVTYEVEMVGNRGVTTQIYIDRCYKGSNGRIYCRDNVSTGNGDNYAKASFISFTLQ